MQPWITELPICQPPSYYLLDTQRPLSYAAVFEKRNRTYGLGGIHLAADPDKFVIEEIDFDRFAAYRNDSGHALAWECLFGLPEWQRVWWREFGGPSQLNILRAGHQGEVIGIAPLMVSGQRASFIGGADVCDYLDFIVSPAKAADFFNLLLDHLKRHGISELDLGPLHPKSTVLSSLVPIVEHRGGKFSLTPQDVTLELDLPATWDEYLGLLKGKQRHEVRRKLRRLHEAGDINFRVIEDAREIPPQITTFFELFKASSDRKAAFMTDQMVSFFQALASAMAASKILKLYILELNAAPVAASMCFDFNAARHLYNSGYDPRFSALSVGLVCKVLSIKDAIESGCKTYDFLKGAETYKYRLGGREVPLVGCRIEL